MNKVKSNALWNELSVEQRATLDKWLVEEKLSYTVAWERAQKEMGYKGSRASLHRYFARRAKEREVANFTALRDEVVAVSAAPGDAASFREASMKVLGQFLFQQVRNAPDKVKEWAAVADLMVRNEYNEIVREAKAREHEIREQAMAFARERFEFDATEQALKALPQLKELEEARKDPNTQRYEENIRWNRARRAVFGFINKVHPESAQEEAEMLAAKREREARREAEAQQLRDREVIINAEPPPPSSQHYAEYMARQAKREAEARESETALDESRAEVSEAGETVQTEREKLLRELREAQSEREADERERERALREYQAQAAEISDVEQARQKKLQEQQAAERAERKRLREEREARAQARLEEMREICGWQEVPRKPENDE
jgi:hypothetical protein